MSLSQVVHLKLVPATYHITQLRLCLDTLLPLMVHYQQVTLAHAHDAKATCQAE